MNQVETKRMFPPSLGDVCPRSGCGLKMSVVRQEDFQVVGCICGYQCKEISGTLKREYHESRFKRTAQRRSQA